MRLEYMLIVMAIAWAGLGLPLKAYAQGDGLLTRDGRRLFAIGFYELPQDAAGLKALAQAGVNLVRCRSRADLDRAAAVGMMGWMPLPLEQGATEALRRTVDSVKDHPALALWEGPDEIVWGFTASSQLEERAGIARSDWWNQTPKAVEYAETQARRIMPNLRDAIALVRSADPGNRQIWINEARSSDAHYVRQYLDHIDITGCDDYPVRKASRPIARIGASTELWKQIGRGKPVWMVLQAFSWSALGRDGDPAEAAYPTFAESRFMAYAAIVHGARGVLYWGSHYVEAASDFRDSIYALTSELAALQPFLTAPEESAPRVTVIGDEDGPHSRGVGMTARRSGREWLIVLVNEDDERRMAVEVSGLDHIKGLSLGLLYGSEEVTVANGGFITRMQPYQVKVFATGREWETPPRTGRDFAQ